jgi:hypothetical protein
LSAIQSRIFEELFSGGMMGLPEEAARVSRSRTEASSLCLTIPARESDGTDFGPCNVRPRGPSRIERLKSWRRGRGMLDESRAEGLPPSRRLTRLFVVVALLILLIEIAYVIGANAVLRTDWCHEVVNRRPDKLRLRWKTAWTWFPGIVHAQGLEMRVQSHRVQWFTTVADVHASFQLLPLCLRHFHASWVHGERVTFRLRRRLDQLSTPAVAVESWPEIPDLSNPPEPPPEKSDTGRRGRPWRITIDESRLDDVEQVWVDSLRLDGRGTAEGRLSTELGKSVTLERTSLRMPSVDLWTAGKQIAKQGDLELALSMDTFVPHGTTFRSLWPTMTGTLRGKGRMSSLAFLALLLQRVPWLTIDGSGQLDMKLVFDHGQIGPGSRVDANADEIALQIFANEARGAGGIHGIVEPGTPPRARLAVDLSEFDLGPQGSEPYVHGEAFRFAALTEDTDFSHGFPELLLSVDLPQSRVARFEAYGEYLPAAAGFRFLSGSGEVSGKVELETRTMTGKGEIALLGKDVRASFEGLPIHGDVGVRLVLAPAAPAEAPRASPTFTLAEAHLRLENLVAAGPPWRGSVDCGGGEVVASKPLRLSSTSFEAQLEDTRPLLAIFAEKKAWARHFDGFLTVEDVHASGRLRIDENAVSVRNLEVKAQGLEILADLDFSGGGKHGLLYARRPPIGFAVEMGAGGRTWKIAGARPWFEERRRARRLP